jgi:hypothetical protein
MRRSLVPASRRRRKRGKALREFLQLFFLRVEWIDNRWNEASLVKREKTARE